MDFFTSMDISSSGMTAERTRMNLISSNIANANSTRTNEGGPYKRKDAIFSAVAASQGLDRAYNRNAILEAQQVKVTGIREDQSPPRVQYDPSHPDADEKGYVSLPNVNVIEEMVDMVSASRAYEANVTAAQAAKGMALKTLDLLR
jgi:flagellar basal-body rod protein FlgC